MPASSLDMHHLVFGINFQIHSVSLTILVSIHLLIHLSTHLISVIIPTLVIHHSFTLSLQAQNLPFQQILPTVDFFYLLDCLAITGLDRTYHTHHYGRPLSVSGRPCYILPMFIFYFFYGRLILRPWLTEVRESFTRGGP